MVKAISRTSVHNQTEIRIVIMLMSLSWRRDPCRSLCFPDETREWRHQKFTCMRLISYHIKEGSYLVWKKCFLRVLTSHSTQSNYGWSSGVLSLLCKQPSGGIEMVSVSIAFGNQCIYCYISLKLLQNVIAAHGLDWCYLNIYLVAS